MEYNSIQDFKSNFAQVYHKSVVPMLAPYETERINIKRKAKLLMLVVFILFHSLRSAGLTPDFVSRLTPAGHAAHGHI